MFELRHLNSLKVPQNAKFSHSFFFSWKLKENKDSKFNTISMKRKICVRLPTSSLFFHNHNSFVMILSFHSMKGKICARLPTSSFSNWGGFQCYGCQWWRSCVLWWMAEPAHRDQNGLDCWNWILDLIFAIIPYWFMFMISPWPVYEIYNLKINEFKTKS